MEGFIQVLLPFLPAILGGVSAIAGIAINIKDIATNKKADGIISDLNIPVILPLAKIIGLGTKSRRSKWKISDGSSNLELVEKAKKLRLNNFRGVFMRDNWISRHYETNVGFLT